MKAKTDKTAYDGDEFVISGLHEQVLSTLPDGVTVQDRDFNILYQNAAMIKAFGSHVGDKCYEIYERRDATCEGCGVRKVFQTGRPNMVLRTAFQENGCVSYWENSCFPLLDEAGNIIAGVEVCRNISDRVSLEGEVKERNIELGQLNKQLSRRTAQLQSALAERREVEQRLKEEIDEHKKHRKALQLTQFCVDNATEAVHWIAEDASLIYVNEAACQALGYSREELLTMSLSEINPSFPKSVWPKRWQEIRAKKSAVFESVQKRKDGCLFPVEIAVNYIQLGDQEYACAFIRDITERKLAEEALNQSKIRLRDILDIASDWIWEVDAQGVYTFCSEGIQKVLGYHPDEVLGRMAFDLMTPDERTRVRASFDRAVAQAAPLVKVESWSLTKDGRRVCLLTNGVPVIDDEGRLIGYRGANQDITERRRYEEALLEKAELEQRLSLIAANIPGFLYTLRQWPDGHFSFPFVSAGIRKLLGLAPDDVAENIDAFRKTIYAEDLPAVEAAVAQTASDLTPLNLEFRICHPERGQLWVESRSLPERMPDGGTMWYGTMTDINKRKDSEQRQKKLMDELETAYRDLKAAQNQIVLQDKMACIGQLAAGVAHEMNTPIGFVASNFETLNKYMDKFIKLLDLYEELPRLIYTGDRDRRLHKVQEIEEAYQAMKMDFVRRDTEALFQESKEGLRRVTNIVQNLRDFSRVDQAEGTSLYDLNDGIKATLTVARNEIKYHADVITDLANTPSICCNSGQINQVLLNILVNAAQAIAGQERGDRGSITVRTALEDSYVVCQISDDGPGMPPEIKKRVFEPFFTTKTVGKGTGLGLSISYDIIVNKHHGDLSVDSEPGRGTTFTIKLPLEPAAPESTAQDELPQAVEAQ